MSVALIPICRLQNLVAAAPAQSMAFSAQFERALEARKALDLTPVEVC